MVLRSNGKQNIFKERITQQGIEEEYSYGLEGFSSLGIIKLQFVSGRQCCEDAKKISLA